MCERRHRKGEGERERVSGFPNGLDVGMKERVANICFYFKLSRHNLSEERMKSWFRETNARFSWRVR